MTNKYPKGAIIVKGNERRKILGEAGEVRFVSSYENFEYLSSFICSCKELETAGWVEEAKSWEPKNGEGYYFIENHGSIEKDIWQCSFLDTRHRSFLGVFPTREAAEARLKEIKDKLEIK